MILSDHLYIINVLPFHHEEVISGVDHSIVPCDPFRQSGFSRPRDSSHDHQLFLCVHIVNLL